MGGEAGAAAVRALGELGPLPAEAAPVLRAILARDESWFSPGGWGAVPKDRAFRRDVARVLENCAG